MELFDTHAHLDDPQIADQLEVLLERAGAEGVRHLLAVGTTSETSRAALRIASGTAERSAAASSTASARPNVYAAVGIQPNYCHEAQPRDWEAIVAMVENEPVAAIGETGLDQHWDFCPFAVQQDWFDRHLRLAQKHDLPVVIHMRDCDEPMLEMLREAVRRAPLRGIMHSFTGSSDTAQACLELGLHLSFAGMVTYKRSDALRQIAASVPLDRLLVETDSPYLSPEPVRKVRPNEPAHVVHTARCLADVRGISLDELARATTANAKALLRIDAA